MSVLSELFVGGESSCRLAISLVARLSLTSRSSLCTDAPSPKKKNGTGGVYTQASRGVG